MYAYIYTQKNMPIVAASQRQRPGGEMLGLEREWDGVVIIVKLGKTSVNRKMFMKKSFEQGCKY